MGEKLSGKLSHQIADASVFSRVIPEQKLAIVTAFQSKGNTVAVTGDGITTPPH